jgi:hypothetical protein
MRSTHSDRLERWLGADRVQELSDRMRGWYGPPIHLLDVPGSVRVCGDGDFVGEINRGGYFSALDSLAFHVKQSLKRAARVRHGELGVGFASISDAVSRASSGFGQILQFNKSGPTGVANVTSTLWRLGNTPAAGSAPSAAPGGRAPTSATTGALPYNNPSSGTMHLTGADAGASVVGNALMLYDRIFDVLKTMNSTTAEAVTGTPSRYQNTTRGNADSASGNFLFIEVGGTALAATAHNWTVCLYTNDAGTTSQTLPSVTGNSGAIVDRLDMPAGQWFCPLAAGDQGILALTQMQCSAAVSTGVINFVIGHPIGVMAFPLANMVTPFDWLTNRQLTPRIFDNACLSLLELNKPSTTATTYTGQIYLTSAA